MSIYPAMYLIVVYIMQLLNLTVMTHKKCKTYVIVFERLSISKRFVSCLLSTIDNEHRQF